MTTNEVRSYVEKHLGTEELYKLLSKENLSLLKKYVRKYYKDIIEEEDGKPEFKVRRGMPIYYNEEGNIKSAYIKCKGRNFDTRECISFNTDMFIGFSGWASTKNVTPIINGFMEWFDNEILKND